MEICRNNNDFFHFSFMAFIGTKYSDFFRYYAGEEGGPELLINEESAVNNIVEDNESNVEHNSAFERFEHMMKQRFYSS